MPSTLRRNARSATLSLAFAFVACVGGLVPGADQSPLRFDVLQGGAQVGTPGEYLDEPLVLRVTRDGQAVPGLAVQLRATAGMLDAVTVLTNAVGIGQTRWRMPTDAAALLGARVVARTVDASHPDSAVFTARGPRADEMDLVVAEPGLPVRLLVYERDAFAAGRYQRADFTDSTRLYTAPNMARNEIVAFAPGLAPLVVPIAWTGRPDTVRLRFSREVIRVPLTIWVVQPPFDSTSKLAQTHLAGVRDSWEAQAGIGLRDVRIVDATGFALSRRFQGQTVPSCDPAIRTDVGTDAGRLNAYYTGQAPIGSAAHCGEGWMQIFPLAWERSRFVLAHEIGHSFLGSHHETIPDNIMHFRGDGTTFSPGQMFRAHYWAGSSLNTIFDAYPTSMRRLCSLAPVTANPGCPPTSFVLD
jgi:hypothetical protein